jgi:hypothetical protein
LVFISPFLFLGCTFKPLWESTETALFSIQIINQQYLPKQGDQNMQLISLMVILASLFTGTLQQPQTFPKKLSYRTMKDQPVELSTFTAEGRAIEPNVAFNSTGANIEWLKGFSFDVKNTSSQPIQFISVNLIFRFNNRASIPSVYTLRKGESMGPNNTPFGKKINFIPGDTIKFEIGDGDFAGLIQFLSSDGMKIEDISSVRLQVSQIDFPDRKWVMGMMFSHGKLLH